MLEYYLAEEISCLSQIDPKKLSMICDLILESQNFVLTRSPNDLYGVKGFSSIFVAGNAGSFLSAYHFVEDLVKPALLNNNMAVRATALGANPGLLQAIANDISWEDIFEFELKTLARTSADLLICLSVSGNSKNVVKACKWAKKQGMKTVAFVGFGGKGDLAKIADVVVAIDSENFGVVEDVTMACLHNIAQCLTRRE